MYSLVKRRSIVTRCKSNINLLKRAINQSVNLTDATTCYICSRDHRGSKTIHCQTTLVDKSVKASLELHPSLCLKIEHLHLLIFKRHDFICFDILFFAHSMFL